MDEALVIGSGRNVWEEYRLGAAALTAPAIFAVNLMTVLLPLAHHAVSHHAEALVGLTRARMAIRSFTQYVTETHSSEYHQEIDHVHHDLREGDSAMLAVRIALRMGAARVVVVGVPLDNRGHVYDDPAAPPGGADHTNYRARWRQFAEDERWHGRVFGVAGFTRDLLGAPA